MRRLLLYLAAALLFCSAGCDFDRPGKREKAEQAEAAQQAALAKAWEAGEALAAGQEKFFRPTADQSAYLEAHTARSASDAVNGFFTNQDGISGYFHGYERPFNFLWIGGTVEMAAFDGRTYRVMDGPGELLLKYQDDALLLQRSKGEFKGGLWQGYGELWNRNREAGGHNYLHYRGEFVSDHMNGRGVYTNYNFTGRGDHPYKYEGDLLDGRFHGQGMLTDLATGEMVYKGLWLEDNHFLGSLEDWRAGDQWSELNSVERQYQDVFMTGDLRLSGFVNSKPGEGALTVTVPQAFEKAMLVDQAGHSYPVGAMKNPDGSAEAGGAMVNGAVVEASLDDYPLVLALSYEMANQRHHFRVTAKRPFGLILSDANLAEKPAASGSEPLKKEELEGRLRDLMRELEDKK